MSSLKDTTIGVVTVGDTAVGKTCLLKRMAHPEAGWSPHSESTIGVEYILMEHQEYSFGLWDTAGQERFASVTQTYLRKGQIILLCFALNQRTSFDNLGTWVNMIANGAPEDAKVILVGTKLDLAEKNRDIAHSEGRSFAENLNRGKTYIEVSAQTTDGLETLKDELVAEAQSLAAPERTATLEEVPKGTTTCC
jgi:Ras-related protein Rab-1A